MTEKEEKIFKCRYCGREYKSNVGRWKHEKKCPQRPVEEEEVIAEEEQITEEFIDEEDEDGITLFDEEDEDEDDEDEDEDEEYIYECPCGHIDTEPFDECPECGTELEWD